MIVADTNLIAALLLKSSASEVADAVFSRDPEWIAPLLWQYEFKNVLVTQMRVLGLPLDEAIALFEKATELIVPSESAPKITTVFCTAQQHKLSGYDAEFLALARMMNIKLVTSDRALLAADGAIAVSPQNFLSHPLG